MNVLGVSSNSFLVATLQLVFQMTVFTVALTAAFFAIGWILWWFGRLLPARLRERVGKFFQHIYYDMFDGAWRLAILGSAAIALTFASAFTTWGGLRSFTEHDLAGQSTPVGYALAFGIAFGIQSVMLIAAWIIGESFAVTTPIRSADIDIRRRAIEAWVGAGLGALFVVIAFVWVLSPLQIGSVPPTEELWRRALFIAQIFATGLLAVGIAYCFRNNEFLGPYVRGLGILAKNVVVWTMFLAALSMSVFFSFDYHFNAIFDETRRTDAANGRAQQKLSSVTNYLNERMPNRLDELQRELFAGKSWLQYKSQLDLSGQIAERSPVLMQEREREARNVRQDRIAELEKALTDQESKIGPLKVRSDVLTPKLESRTAQLREFRHKEDEQDARVKKFEQDLATAKAAAKREKEGVPGDGRTGKAGEGTEYGKAQKKVEEAQGNLDAAKIEMATVQGQAKTADNDVTNLLAEQAGSLPALTELLAKAKATKQALEIERRNDSTVADVANPLSLARKIDVLASEFRRTPSPKTLGELQESCSELKAIGKKVGDAESERLNCDPKNVNEALTAFLAEKKRTEEFMPACTTGASVAGKGVDAMINLAERCLQDSRLPSDELVAHYKTIRTMRDIRDDKAQSFIRTMSAVEDRNPLAGLALAIALTVDSLILFAGVFAATTITGPLQKAGLRDLARQVRQLPAREVRWALAALRGHAFAAYLCEDPRINRIVTLGLDRQIPTEASGTFLVTAMDGEPVEYRLHQIYLDELQELVRRAERMGELRVEPPRDPGSPDGPATTTANDEQVIRFAPRRSARG